MESNHDSISIFISIRIIILVSSELQKRNITILDHFLEAIGSMLSKKVAELLKSHAENARSIMEAKYLKINSADVHVLTRNFGIFLFSSLSLFGKDECNKFPLVTA